MPEGQDQAPQQDKSPQPPPPKDALPPPTNQQVDNMPSGQGQQQKGGDNHAATGKQSGQGDSKQLPRQQSDTSKTAKDQVTGSQQGSDHKTTNADVDRMAGKKDGNSKDNSGPAKKDDIVGIDKNAAGNLDGQGDNKKSQGQQSDSLKNINDKSGNQQHLGVDKETSTAQLDRMADKENKTNKDNSAPVQKERTTEGDKEKNNVEKTDNPNIKNQTDNSNPFDRGNSDNMDADAKRLQREKNIRNAIAADDDAILHRGKLGLGSVSGSDTTKDTDDTVMQDNNKIGNTSKEEDGEIDTKPTENNNPPEKERSESLKDSGDQVINVDDRSNLRNNEKKVNTEIDDSLPPVEKKPSIDSRDPNDKVYIQGDTEETQTDRAKDGKGIKISRDSDITGSVLIQMIHDDNRIPQNLRDGITYDQNSDKILISPVREKADGSDKTPAWYRSMITASDMGEWVLTTGKMVYRGEAMNFQIDFKQKPVRKDPLGNWTPNPLVSSSDKYIAGVTVPNQPMARDKGFDSSKFSVMPGDGRGLIVLGNRIAGLVSGKDVKESSKDIVDTFFHETALHAGRFSADKKDPRHSDKELEKWNSQLKKMFH